MNCNGVIEKGWCKSCGKSEDSAEKICYYDDPFWLSVKKKNNYIVEPDMKTGMIIHPVLLKKPYNPSKGGKKTKKRRVNYNKPEQPLPITIDNFYIRTRGTFTEIHAIPSDFFRFFTSKTSLYFTNKDRTKLIRSSDHWGANIRYCTWFLDAYKKEGCHFWQKRYGKNMRIGIIDFQSLTTNNEQKKEKIESRHPI